jgi:hypothetical protein
MEQWNNRVMGPGEEEVTKMVRAPSCSTCGSFLTGFELDKELNFFVYFCPECRSAEEKAARPKGKEEVAVVEAIEEAA